MDIGKLVGNVLNITRTYVESQPDYLAKKYFRDAEWYRKHGHQQVYKILRKMCLDSFAAIDDPKKISETEGYIKKYLPKNHKPRP